MIISQTKNPFLGVVFDEDHDFEGLSAPKAHLDPVLANVTNVLEQGSSSKLVSLYFKLYEFFLTRQSAAALSLKLRGRGGRLTRTLEARAHPYQESRRPAFSLMCTALRSVTIH